MPHLISPPNASKGKKTDTPTPQQQYAALESQKNALNTQLTQLAMQLYDQSSSEVQAQLNSLQLEKTKQQGAIAHAQQKLAQISPQLANFEQGAEAILLQAIAAQRWYSFKNKREIIFDSYVGMLFPNFAYVPHIEYDNWKNAQKDYAPSGVAIGQWKTLPDYWYVKNGQWLGYNYRSRIKDHVSDFYILEFDYPNQYKGVNLVRISQAYYALGNDKYYYYLEDFSKNGSCNWTELKNNTNGLKAFPALRILDREDIIHGHPSLTALEKARIVFDFMQAQDWQPHFEHFLAKNSGESDRDFNDRVTEAQQQCDEYNRLCDLHYQRLALQKQLVQLEQQLADLPAPEPENFFTSAFDYRQELPQYNLDHIGQSVWQYSHAVQHWTGALLAHLDDWANRHQHLLAHALTINNTLAKKPSHSKHLTETEQHWIATRHQHLQQRLNFGLEPVRNVLLSVLQQAQQLEYDLQAIEGAADSLTQLAQLQHTARPSFALVAEHTATLCTQSLKKLEWLEQSLDFVQAIVQSEQQMNDDYLIFLDKYQQDLLQQGQDNSIEAHDVEKWFAEWRQESQVMQQRWWPLVEAGLNGVIANPTVLDTLACLAAYQQALDQFYLQSRLGVHTKFAFQPNGHRQEKLEKEQELTKLNHQFMQQLQKVIFATQTSAQKIWLVRFSEVWQHGMVQEITQFLSHEQLLDRSDIAQIVMDEMRKLQQQSLAACLQDAKSYSQALEQRDKDFGTLMFKMRKALQKDVA